MLSLCFKQIFKDIHPTIAVSKKCCYCCNLLGIILNSDRDVDHQFKMPASSRIICPWAPPANLDATVLGKIKDALTGEVLEQIENQRSLARSRSRLRQEPPDSDIPIPKSDPETILNAGGPPR